MEHILRILALAERSERIGIVLSSDAGDAELLAAHALKDKLGEKAIILNAPEHLQDRWSHLFKKERPQKETALSIDMELHPVEELRYEKEGGKLRIYLGGSELTKDAFVLEHLYPACDMIIALGFSSEVDIRRLIETDIPLKNPDSLITITPVSVTTYAAAPQTLPTAPIHTWDINAMKLWSRALLRSYTEENASVFWAFLPKEDFQKTNTSADILPDLVHGMRMVMSLPALCILLWQDQTGATENVHILVSGENQSVLQQLADVTETPLTDGNLVIRGFPNFSEAEAEMRKLLKQLHAN